MPDLKKGFIHSQPNTLIKLLNLGFNLFNNTVVTKSHDRYLIDVYDLIHPIHESNKYAHGNAREFIETEHGFEWLNNLEIKTK